MQQPKHKKNVVAPHTSGHDDLQSSKTDASLPSDQDCGYLSRLFLAWLTPLIRRGYREVLAPHRITRLASRHEASVLIKRVDEVMSGEINNGLLYWLLFRHCSPLLKVTYALEPTKFKIAFWASIAWGLLNTVGKPLLVKVVIAAAVSGDATKSVIALLLFVAANVLDTIFLTTTQLLGDDLAAVSFSWLGSKVLQKSMKLKPGQGGNEAGLFSDMNRNMLTAGFIFQLPGNYVSILSGLILLAVLVSWPGVVAFFFLQGLGEISTRLGKKSQSYAKKHLAAADDRLDTTKEMIEGIKAVKFLTWEQNFLDILNFKRKVEVKWVKKYRTIMVLATTIGRTNCMLAAALCFAILVTVSDSVDAQTIFTALAVFFSLRIPMLMLAWSTMLMEQLRTMFARMDKYFDLPEASPLPRLESSNSTILEFKSASFKWSGADTNCLHSLDVTIQKGTSTAIMGAVGCGKSSFIGAMFSGLDVTGGHATIAQEALQSVAYAPQTPLVITGTVQQNIVMHHPFDSARFDYTIKACSMTRDLQLFAHGDQTDIGENGVTLSGGQKARLGLARAVYSQAKFLVVDDALAAVDPVVAAEIFGGLSDYASSSGSTLVMALNQLQLLSRFSHIVFLKHGSIESQGTFEHLRENNTAFVELVDQFGELNTSVDDTPPKKEEAPASHTKTNLHRTIKISRVKSSQEITGKKSTKAKTSLISKEHKETGQLSGNLYFVYARAMGWCLVIPSLIVGLGGYMVSTFMDLWVNEWIAKKNAGTDSNSDLLFYACGGILFYITLNIFSVSFAEGCANASRTVHKDTIQALMRAPITWFESTPSGRILSRFSVDLNIIDTQLSQVLDPFMHTIMMALCFVVYMCWMVPGLIILIVFSMIFFSRVIGAVEKSVLELKRETNNAMSPLMTNLTEISHARQLIQLMGYDGVFLGRHVQYMNNYLRLTFVTQSVQNWTKMIGGYLATLIGAVSVALVLFAGSNDTDPEIRTGQIGINVAYTLTIPSLIAFIFYMVSETKKLSRFNRFFFCLQKMMLSLFLLSLERFIEYQQVEQEAKWHEMADSNLLSKWPSQGAIEFRQASLRYRPELPRVIHAISFKLIGGSKTGVVGRTGAGKSSLMLLLFRILEPEEGGIWIDGVNIANVGLHSLRKHLAIIPQDSLLLRGTVRHNLDPFKEKEEHELVHVLRQVGLYKQDENLLDRDLSDATAGISAGEQQLISLARTLLRKEVHICVMDEPTANIDMATDETIQKVVRQAFHGITMITIAHRLNTIIDYDNVLVMDSGKISEFGPGATLLNDPTSHLSELATSLGENAATQLKAKAQQRRFLSPPAQQRRLPALQI